MKMSGPIIRVQVLKARKSFVEKACMNGCIMQLVPTTMESPAVRIIV